MSEQQDAPPTLVDLDDHIARGRRLLEKGDLRRGILQMWLFPLRTRLRRFFGDIGEVNSLFPDIAEGLAPAQHAAILAEKLAQTEAFAAEARKALICSYHKPRGKVFFGHGRSPVWREFKDFVADRLRLPWDEFNRDAVAGLTTFERLSQMLSEASFAFLIMTAEDEHSDKSVHARENVVHELGLFQGHLGPRRSIILLEDGCAEFSNIIGLSQIRFPKNTAQAAFENMRRVLERERLI